MKMFTRIVFLLTVGGLGTVGEPHPDGTIIVVDASQGELVIAADSREAGTRSYDDHGCKISTFGNEFVFTAAGRPGLRNHPESAFWDAHAVAKKEFIRLVGKSASHQPTSAEFARAWGRAIKREIETRIAHPKDHLLAGIPDNLIMKGFFGRISKDGSLDATFVAVTHQPAGETIQIQVSAPQVLVWPKDFPQFFGRGDILAELGKGSFLSETWNRELERKVRGSGDEAATGAVEYVRLTIDHLPADRTDVNGRPFSVVGYPISAVKATSRGIEWIQRGNCPQD